MFLGGAQAIASSCLSFLIPCSLFASSFSLWYIHKSCSFTAICKASSVFVCSIFFYFFNDFILQSFTRSVLHAELTVYEMWKKKQIHEDARKMHWTKILVFFFELRMKSRRITDVTRRHA